MLIQCGVNTQPRARLLMLTPIIRWWGGSWTQTGPGSHTDTGYSGVFSCQPVSWFPPPQVLQYANMLAACDGCCSVWTAGEECDAAAREMDHNYHWIWPLLTSGCILQLRHSAHCSADTLALVIITQSIITLFISKPYHQVIILGDKQNINV